MKYDKDDGLQFFKELGEYTRFHRLMDELNKNPIKTNVDANIKRYNEFCEKFEYIKADFIERLIQLNELGIITDNRFDEDLEPYIPKCNYDVETEIFTMDFNFVPHLKAEYLKKFVKAKNAFVFLIMEGIKKMDIKPHYNKEPVMVIFTISKKYLFDVDNVEIKYIIDAMRYSKFFYDDSYNYLSYMVQGNETDGPCLMTIKVIKKSDFIL